MKTLHPWFILASLAAFANGKQVQVANLKFPCEFNASAHKQAVVDLFNVSYTAYKEFAFGHDTLLPVTESYLDNLGGWGATIVDALGTMHLMGFNDWFNEGVNHLTTVDFGVSETESTVNLFETTIRHVGGLLSAYELSGQDNSSRVLVNKAEQLVQQLAYAFVGNNTVPYNDIYFVNHTVKDVLTNLAAAGTLTLEWNRLSSHTGNDTYRQLAEQAVQHIINMPTIFPGMPAMRINVSTGNSNDSFVTWGSGCDSFYEYLIKYPRLTNTDDNSYADAWLTAVDSSISTLLRTSTVGDWTHIADFDGTNILHGGSHLKCFYGGNWILGGKLTNNDTIFNFGVKLTDACWNTYAGTATGIGPEVFSFVSSDGNLTTNSSQPTKDQLAFYNAHGYYISVSDYILRPEVLESNFYAWRATGDKKYLDNAVSAYQSFKTYLPTTVAYAGIDDVNNKTSSKFNMTQSFWFAETLKYLYLTFDDPEHISLDDYVFNTEAHPFKAPPAKDVYGSGL